MHPAKAYGRYDQQDDLEMQGPITDRLGQMLKQMSSRLDQRMEDLRSNQRDLFAKLEELRTERKSILNQLNEMRKDRTRLLSRIEELRQEAKSHRESTKKERLIFNGRILDKITRLFWIMLAMCVLLAGVYVLHLLKK
jgi:uncharacterized coiled-coil DUF342 family protein